MLRSAISGAMLVVLVAVAVLAAAVAMFAVASFAFPGLHLLRHLLPFHLAHFLRGSV